MKGISIKRNRKTILFHSDWRSPVLTLYCMSVSLSFTSTPLRLATPSILVCSVICASCGSLFYMCWLLGPGLALLRAMREPLTHFTIYSCCCWLSHSVSPTVGLFSFDISLQLRCCFSLGILPHFHNVLFSWDRAVYGKHSTEKQYLANPTFCSRINWTSNCSRHLVSTVTNLHWVLL